MGSQESIQEIKKRLEKEKTSYLQKVLENSDTDEWTDQELDAISQILKERGENVPIPLSELLRRVTIVTTPILDNRKIEEYLGIVSSVMVLGTGLLTELGGGIADFLGTSAGGFEEKLVDARETVLADIITDTLEKGGNGIIGVDFDYMALSNNLLMVSVNGTAIKFAPESKSE